VGHAALDGEHLSDAGEVERVVETGRGPDGAHSRPVCTLVSKASNYLNPCSAPPAWDLRACVSKFKHPPLVWRFYILAAIDPHSGEVIAQAHERHRGREFILLLQELDEHYPKDGTIRLVLDDHRSAISQETMAYLSTRPNRFIYVHTPKHGSWLNLIETVFGKMARTFLKGIRVKSREELKQRILQGVREMNLAPVVARWKKFDLGLV
jgi:transposase